MSRADARANRERIAAAAREVLAADPRAGMADIAERAGLSRVTLYGHVGSRADLMAAVVGDHAAAAEESLRLCLARPLDAEVLDEVVRDSWRTLSASATLMVEAEAELGADRVRQYHQPLIDALADWIRSGRRSGVLIGAGDPLWLAHAYYSLVRVAVSLSGQDAGAIDLERELLRSVRSLWGVTG